MAEKINCFETLADEKYGKNLVEMIVGLGCFESKCLNELKT